MSFILKISGTDAYKFLQGLASNDVGKLTNEVRHTGESQYPESSLDAAIHAYLLTPQGKYLFDFFIVKKDEAFYLIVLPTEKFSELLKKLKMYKLRSDVVIEDISSQYSVLSTQFFDPSLRGALATWQSILTSETSDPMDCFAKAACNDECLITFQDPRFNGKKIIYSIIKKDKNPSTINHQQLTNYTQIRIDNLIPEGSDFEYEGTYPLQYRMKETNSVDFKKGCYVGQEVTARMRHKTGVRKTLYKVQSDENLEAHSGKEILEDELVVGKLLSASGNTALAFLSVDAATENSQLTCSGVRLKVFPSFSQ